MSVNAQVKFRSAVEELLQGFVLSPLIFFYLAHMTAVVVHTEINIL